MTWQRSAVAGAIADVLSAADPTAATFATPPETFNVPAYIVGYPRTVAYSVPVFGVDQASLPVIVAVGLGEADAMDAMFRTALAALSDDVSLGAVVQSCTAREQSNWRPANVGGANLMLADLVLEIRM
jgi:hypothetical protein